MTEENSDNGDRQTRVQLSFSIDGVDDEFNVLAFYGSEGISRLFSYNLELACRSNSVDLSQAVGRTGLLTITRSSQSRHIHGVVSRIEQRNRGQHYTSYQAHLVPRARRLLLRQDCRYFQDTTSRDIVSQLLSDASITNRITCAGGQDPPRREYCAQYRESDWNFISRLLEDDGFFYYFEHSESDHTLVIANDAQVHDEISGTSTVEFREPSTTAAAAEHIFELSHSEQMVSGGVAHQDYNFEMPTMDFGTNEEGERDSELEVYDYPGVYQSPEDGRSVSQIRLQEIESTRRGGKGQSDCTRLVPGYLFTLSGHDRSDLNDQEYLLTEVQHQATTEQDLDEGRATDRCTYSNFFRFIRSETPFRAERSSTRPRVLGSQTAEVVGPPGEEVHTNEHGQVRVQFHWDREGQRNEQSTCWVRVSQFWAGQGYGAMFIPRIGHEVIVDFLEGDPDRPIITGSVYHAQNVPPLVLPDEATRSTIKSNSSLGGGGFNELRFEDKAGEEELYTHAQRDQIEVVEHNMSTSVGCNRSLSVSGNRTETIGGDEKVTIKGDRTEEVVKNEKITITKDRELQIKQNHTVKVDQNQDYVITQNSNETVNQKKSAHVKGDYSLRCYGSINVKAGNVYELTCGTTKARFEKGGKVTIEGGSSIELKVGSSHIRLEPAMIDIKSDLVKINS